MRWVLFEDDAAGQLAPVSLARPVFELVCGREGLRRRVQRWFPASRWGVLIRPWLTETYSESHPDALVNDLSRFSGEPVLLINGRWMPRRRLNLETVTANNAGVIDGQLAWVALSADESTILCDSEFPQMLSGIVNSREAVEASGTMISRPWDLVNLNAEQLQRDFNDEGVSQSTAAPHVQCLGLPQDVYISQHADIDPYVVFDARNGPISIDRDVQIQSFTRIEGPCHVAEGSRIFHGQIHHGTTIGPCCRVGGEVEESILHSYVNKYHEGFLGHSYVCPWVNLGAITTTSDLKSDYSDVSVPLQGEHIETGTMKVGSFIGDHSKTAIDSMFNTGTSVGVMTLVLPGGRLLPRHIPSFCNVSFGSLADDWSVEQSLQTAAAAMKRRGLDLTDATKRLFQEIHRRTAPERNKAVTKSKQRLIRRATAG